MAHTFYFGNVKKRINSTLQGGTSAAYDVLFKNPTSLDTPTITLRHSGDFDYNYARYKDYYYFVVDKKALANDMWEVTMELDSLATAKADILASTQFVSYSNVSGGVWLPDTRIAANKDAIVGRSATTMNFLFTDGGFYVLSVVGKNGAELWCCDKSHLTTLLSNIASWSDRLIGEITTGDFPFDSPSSFTFNWDTVEEGIQSLARLNAMTGIAGNAYASAPSCIRSCVWVPFFAEHFAGDSAEIYLGQFPTGVTTYKCKATPHASSFTINIPWHYSDYRRATCEDVYLYLPLVGVVALSSDNLVGINTLTVKWSATASDGCVAYEVLAGGQVIATFGGQVSVNYPVGVSQQASAGEIFNTIMGGVEKRMSGGLTAAGGMMSGNPIAVGSGIAEGGLAIVTTPYNVIDTLTTRNNSCVGGIGGGAGVGLDTFAICYTVAHSTVIEPTQMAATMGVPTMKPLQLSNCSGYCQCANAHVSTDLDAPWIAKIDAYLNNGFYIE